MVDPGADAAAGPGTGPEGREALLARYRALVLRDGRIAVDVPIDLPRPRVLGGHAFDALRGRLLHELGVDVDTGEDAAVR